MSFCRFPSLVKTSDGSEIDRAAVVVIDGRAEMAVTAKRGEFDGGGVSVIASIDDVTVGEPANRVTRLTAADGQWWDIGQGSGCGCRSVLSMWYQERIAGQPMGT